MAERKQEFFHGTTFDIPVGHVVAPAKFSGNSNWENHGVERGQSSKDYAFATEDEDTAWDFATMSGEAKRSKGMDSAVIGYHVDEPRRVAVYKVAPHEKMEPGVYHRDSPDFVGGRDLREWRAPFFRTTDRIDIMPGRQGTFSELNWNQFGRGMHHSLDANHPTDNEIREGHLDYHAIASGYESAKKRAPYTVKPLVDKHQLDLFSGRTVGEHAKDSTSEVGDYHRNNLNGKQIHVRNTRRQ